MRHDWITANLGELCDFTSGLWKGEKPPFVHVGVIRNTNFTPAGYLDDTDIAFLDVEKAQFLKRQLQVGDIILEKSGGGPKQPVGRVILFDKVEGNFSFSNFTAAIRVKDAKVLDYRFLHKLLHYYYVSGRTEPLQRHSTGIRNLQLTAYKGLEIALPPLPEQQRIAGILDEAFARIDAAAANAERNLASAREVFDGYIDSVFARKGEGWRDHTVGELADHSLGKMLDKQKNRGTPHPYLRNLNVRWFGFDLSDVLKMRFEDAEVDRYSVRKGDLVICEGGYPGRAAIWDRDDPMFFQKALHRVRFRNPIHTRWFLYYLYLSESTGELRKHFSGAGIQHFTGKALAQFQVPMAPDDVIARYVEVFDVLIKEGKRLEAVYQRKLAALAELKQSILQKAFAGELTAKAAERELAAA